MRICIIGAGAYGCYATNSVLEKYPDAEITIIEAGDSNIKDEKEIGYLSNLINRKYKGLKNGRFFGNGGTTERWGGQLLFYSKNDFENPNSFLSDVIKLNEKYKNKVLSRFGLEQSEKERFVSSTMFTKTGVWLSVFKRNFFKFFQIVKKNNVKLISNARVSRILVDNYSITEIKYLENGVEYSKSFDFYFLTAGAFETARILLSSGLLPNERVFFSDHLSQKVFKVINSTTIAGEDFAFKMEGLSLITKRLVGEYNDSSYYVHPVFNMDFPFFQGLKLLLFKKKYSIITIFQLFVNIPQAISFLWSVIVKKRIYVHNNTWFLYIDIDNPTTNSYVELSGDIDKFGLEGLNVSYSIGEDSKEIYNAAINEVLKLLKAGNINFEILNAEIDVDNIEDIYHPHKMFNYNTVNDLYTNYTNMLIVNTGILPRSGGINPTAALFPLIEEFVQDYLKIRIENIN